MARRWFSCTSAVLLTAIFGPTVCALEAAESTLQPGHGLSVIDWMIIAVYACGTIGLGWYYSRQQCSTKEYFVGTGRMNPVLIGVSLFATLLSTISYLSMPGESLGKGPTYMLSLLAVPAVFGFVGFVLLPVYMKQRVTSAYELLETKLGPEIRTLGAVMFITLRLVWMSLLIYMTAKAMTVMLGVNEDKIPLIAAVTGFVAVVYTSLGGLRAVVITDFLQTVLLFGGALLVLAMITLDLGGFGWVPTQWNPTWDTQPFFSTDLSTRVTVVGTFLNYFFWYTCTLGGDQTSVQRFMATEDAGAARRALATQFAVGAIVAITLGFVGFALLGYYQAHPEQLPAELSLSEDADKVFPHFIAFQLPPGVAGLVVAAMFAAAMSSIDSGVNSITAVVLTDLSGRWHTKNAGPVSEAPLQQPGDGNPYEPPQTKTAGAQVSIARWMAFGIGAVVVVGSSFMGSIPGNITAVTTKTANLLTTPIFALFFFALFVPFASPRGVILGAICGTATAVLIAFSGPISGAEVDPISFQWIAPVSIAVNLVTGCIGSLLMPRMNRNE